MNKHTYQFNAGEEVDSWCTKCKEMQPHKVKSVTEGRTPRVICLVCQGEHNFRPSPPKTRAKKKKKEEDTNPWEKLIVDYQDREAIPYSIDKTFNEGDLIDHKKFGKGIVLEIMDSSKMKVAFKDKKRIMIYNKGTV